MTPAAFSVAAPVVTTPRLKKRTAMFRSVFVATPSLFHAWRP